MLKPRSALRPLSHAPLDPHFSGCCRETSRRSRFHSHISLIVPALHPVVIDHNIRRTDINTVGDPGFAPEAQSLTLGGHMWRLSVKLPTLTFFCVSSKKVMFDRIALSYIFRCQCQHFALYHGQDLVFNPKP